MSDKEDYMTTYRVFFENFAATVNPEDQLPVNIAGYSITESELPGEVLYWTTQYLSEKQCPSTLLTPLLRIILEEVRVASKKQPTEFGYKSDESAYVALRLMQAVTARVNAVCLRYLDNSRLDTLPPPPPAHLQELKTVSAATKNSRRVMEDRHVEIGNLESLFGIETSKPTSFYAVYDGHAGSAAATYCAAHLHQYVVESPHFATDLRKALRDAFLRTDNEFIRKSNQERACGGSTAVAVAVRGRQLHAAWAGDSLALLAKRMRLMQLVRPHKPSRQDEKDRIIAGGGTVMYWGTWRVNGQLAVSRAIGDAMYKPYVTARPELATVDLDGDEDFVVVACDGLWDFVSEDDVALAVYRQLAADPDDLKAVTKRLIVQAKRQGSCDNISIIVVFLKDPRDIAADNRPPMDLGLDNALVNASLPPFAVEAAEACKRQMEAAEVPLDLADNGVDNSDSDSEDLGPETAVDVDDLDNEARNHVEPTTPPAHAVEASHIDGSLADNVAESGEESEDEWNYFKGEGSEQQPAEPGDPDDRDEPPRSETPCQDNSAWETSSVDMNSSPLNPDAPVFIPGTAAGSDILLAESPRKPQQMDDIELPDVAQFETEAIRRPAELLDLDNCDQLNGHHNVSFDGVTEQLNGNEKSNLDSLGFGFSVGEETDKVKDNSHIEDFERIQKDTTDFCNIQVFQAHTETNPFASDDNEELLERLKNKERDPMSMSFYQEKDDDSCERDVDLNAVQPLPDSDDEDSPTSPASPDADKENVSPLKLADVPGPEPNNDIITLDDRTQNFSNDPFSEGNNFMDFVNDTNNLQNFPNMNLQTDRHPQENVMQTDTPESHKLLFEQIPEIPDGKSSELGFNYEDNQDPSDRAITPQEETSQDVDMECKPESPCIESASQPSQESQDSKIVDSERVPEDLSHHIEIADSQITSESHTVETNERHSSDRVSLSPEPVRDDRCAEATTPEPAHELQENIKAEIHNYDRVDDQFDNEIRDAQTPHNLEEDVDLLSADVPTQECLPTTASPVPSDAVSPAPALSPAPVLSPEPVLSPVPVSSEPAESPAPPAVQEEVQEDLLAASEAPVSAKSPTPSPVPEVVETLAPAESPLPPKSPVPEALAAAESPLPTESPLMAQSPLPHEELAAHSPLPAEVPLPDESSVPSESPLPASSPLPVESALLVESSIPRESPMPADVELPSESPLPAKSPLPVASPLPAQSPLPAESPMPTEPELRPETASPLAAAVPLSPSPAPETARLTPEVPAEEPARLTPGVPTEEPARLTPEVPVEVPAPEVSQEQAQIPEASGPTPDIVPEERTEQSHREIVTDIDIGIPESHAQEICVPVTNEIEDEGVHLAAGTPPPTPAVEPAPAADALIGEPASAAAPLAAVAAAGVAAAAAVAATAAVAKSKTPAKKPGTTPTTKTSATAKSATKASSTPASAAKKPATTPTAARPAAARTSLAAKTPVSASKPKPASTAAAAKPSPKPAARTSPAPAKEPTATAKTSTAARAAPAPRPAPKAAAPRPAAAAAAPKTAPARPAAARPAAPAARPASAPAPKPAAARPAPAARAATRPTPAAAPAKPKETKAPEKKPLINGDAKAPAPIKKAPLPARPAPRPAPRPATAPAAKPSAPKPAAPRAALDKQTKDLANKRITAKAAPPRTAATKAAPISKTNSVPKSVPKKPIEKQTNGLVNGGGDGAGDALKPPPSPPADNALLPDVIA